MEIVEIAKYMGRWYSEVCNAPVDIINTIKARMEVEAKENKKK